jgi:hypothetical protein
MNFLNKIDLFFIIGIVANIIFLSIHYGWIKYIIFVIINIFISSFFLYLIYKIQKKMNT